MTAMDTTWNAKFDASNALTDDDGCEDGSEQNYWLARNAVTNQRLLLDLGCATTFSCVIVKNSRNGKANNRLIMLYCKNINST